VDYKNVALLTRFVNDRGKIAPRRITGTCASHQRILVRAVKRARYVALLPFAREHYR
jgi:small subunit ribosomal protein S18